MRTTREGDSHFGSPAIHTLALACQGSLRVQQSHAGRRKASRKTARPGPGRRCRTARRPAGRPTRPPPPRSGARHPSRRDCWHASDPRRAGAGGAQAHPASNPYQALGLGGRYRHGLSAPYATGERAGEAEDVAVPADKREGRCASPERRSAHRPPVSFARFGTALSRGQATVQNPTRANCNPLPGATAATRSAARSASNTERGFRGGSNRLWPSRKPQRPVDQSVRRSTAGITASVAIKFQWVGRPAAAREQPVVHRDGAPEGGPAPRASADGDPAGDDLDRRLVGGRRTRSDSVKPAESALAYPSARFASLARDLHPNGVSSAHRAPLPLGVRGGTAPRHWRGPTSLSPTCPRPVVGCRQYSGAPPQALRGTRSDGPPEARPTVGRWPALPGHLCTHEAGAATDPASAPVDGHGHRFRRGVGQPDYVRLLRCFASSYRVALHPLVTRRAISCGFHPQWVSVHPSGTKASEADPRPSQGSFGGRDRPQGPDRRLHHECRRGRCGRVPEGSADPRIELVLSAPPCLDAEGPLASQSTLRKRPNVSGRIRTFRKVSGPSDAVANRGGQAPPRCFDRPPALLSP